jgi:hypothetical protein
MWQMERVAQLQKSEWPLTGEGIQKHWNPKTLNRPQPRCHPEPFFAQDDMP